MTAKHGTRRRYVEGCRCEDCTAANRLYFRERRAGVGADQLRARPTQPAQPSDPGAVESGVEAEIEGLAEARPGLAQAALAIARVLDNPKAVATHPPAAKALAGLLEKLRSASAHGRRGNLALVRTMTEKGGEQPNRRAKPATQ
jgi:hypothetical protein